MGAAASVAAVTGLIVVVVRLVVPAHEGGYSSLDAHLEALSMPGSLQLVETEDEGQGRKVLASDPAVLQVYASPELPGALCSEVHAALERWGEVVTTDPLPPGPVAGCGYGGSIDGDDGATFRVDVRLFRQYLEEEPGGTEGWDDAAATPPATVVEVRAMAGG